MSRISAKATWLVTSTRRTSRERASGRAGAALLAHDLSEVGAPQRDNRQHGLTSPTAATSAEREAEHAQVERDLGAARQLIETEDRRRRAPTSRASGPPAPPSSARSVSVRTLPRQPLNARAERVTRGQLARARRGAHDTRLATFTQPMTRTNSTPPHSSSSVGRMSLDQVVLKRHGLGVKAARWSESSQVREALGLAALMATSWLRPARPWRRPSADRSAASCCCAAARRRAPRP